jgi:hypothetical protein
VRPAAATRLLSNRSAVEEHARPPVRWGWVVVLVLAALAAGAFHGYRYLQRRSPPPLPTFSGAPAGAVGIKQGSTRIIISSPAQPANAAEIERLKTLEQAKGNIVRQVGPNSWIVMPPKPGEPGGTR